MSEKKKRRFNRRRTFWSLIGVILVGLLLVAGLWFRSNFPGSAKSRGEATSVTMAAGLVFRRFYSSNQVPEGDSRIIDHL